MKTQIDNGRLDMKRIEREIRWGPYKAIAAIVTASAAMVGVILALAHWVHP